MEAPPANVSAAVPTDRRLRIVELAWSGARGGAERSLLDFAGCLDRTRFDCRFVFLADELWLGPELRRLGFSSESLAWRSPRSLAGRARMVRRLACLRPDVIHDHVLPTFTRSLLAARFPDVARISTDHGVAPILDVQGARFRAALYGWDFRRAHRIVVHSHAMARLATRLFRPLAGQLAEVPLGTAITVDPLPARLPDGTYRIGFLGRIQNFHKGLDVLLRALALMRRDDRGSVQLLAAGDGPDRDAGEALAASLGIGSDVRFLGWTDDKLAFFRQIDVLAVPSRLEPFGLVALESLAAGRTVVASAVGGLVEIAAAIPGIRLSAPNDPRAFADALWAAKDGMRGYRAAEAAQMVVERFGAQTMTRRLEALYVETIASLRRAHPRGGGSAAR